MREKNRDRDITSVIQLSLECEAKGKAEACKARKKLESDINEMELSLDHANRYYG